MPTRKNIKSKKSNKIFRKTRKTKKSKRKNRKTRSNRQRGGGSFFSKPETPEPETHECPICQEVLHTDSITTACGHTFDIDCIRRWCRQRGEATECPLCRGPIGQICRELLLFTNLEKNLLDAIKINRDGYSIVEAENALIRGVGVNGENLNPELLNINVTDENGDTPLLLAIDNDDEEMVRLLLYYGADVGALNADSHITDNNNILNLLTDYYDLTDDAVEASDFSFGNRGGKRKQKKGKQKV